MYGPQKAEQHSITAPLLRRRNPNSSRLNPIPTTSASLSGCLLIQANQSSPDLTAPLITTKLSKQAVVDQVIQKIIGDNLKYIKEVRSTQNTDDIIMYTTGAALSFGVLAVLWHLQKGDKQAQADARARCNQQISLNHDDLGYLEKLLQKTLDPEETNAQFYTNLSITQTSGANAFAYPREVRYKISITLENGETQNIYVRIDSNEVGLCNQDGMLIAGTKNSTLAEGTQTPHAITKDSNGNIISDVAGETLNVGPQQNPA